MPTSTVENYVKQLLLMQQGQPADLLIPIGRLASAVGVVPGTATTMVKTLADSGLVYYEARNGVRLAPGGEKLALHVLRRHRIMELFLVRVLGLDWSEVHAEAEVLEHAISDKVLEQMDALLGRPDFDPHGDPIPSPTGQMSHRQLLHLSEGTVGQKWIVARLADQDPDFLRFVEESGLKPGTLLEIASRNDQADALRLIRPDKVEVTIGLTAARRILVQPEENPA